MQPPRYDRVKDFTADYGDNTDHAALNAELDGVSQSVNALRANAALIQRDDGALQNGIVTSDALAPELADEIIVEVGQGIDDKVQEAQAAANDAVNAATDATNAATNSQSYAEQSLASAGSAQAYSQSASASKDAAATSATDAAGSATAAASSEAAAADSAAIALASKNAAGVSEGNAADSATAAAGSATSASTSAGTATTKAGEASDSAAAALASKNAAATSEGNAADSEAAAAASAASIDASVAQWNGKAIGEIFYLRDDLVGVAKPPTNNPVFRFIKLTAADSYNSGVLTSESVSGSAPLVIATAVISLAGSPINGLTINLLNTEKRFLQAGTSGEVGNRAMPSHYHQMPIGYDATNITQHQDADGLPIFGYVITPPAGITYQSRGAPTSSPAVHAYTDSGHIANTADLLPKYQGVTAYMRIL